MRKYLGPRESILSMWLRLPCWDIDMWGTLVISMIGRARSSAVWDTEPPMTLGWLLRAMRRRRPWKRLWGGAKMKSPS